MRQTVQEEKEQLQSLHEQLSKLENELEYFEVAKTSAATNWHAYQNSLMRRKLLQSRVQENQQQYKYAHSKYLALDQSLKVLERETSQLMNRIRTRSDIVTSDEIESLDRRDEDTICKDIEENQEILSSLRVEQRALLERLCDSPIVSNGSFMQKQKALSEFQTQAAKVATAVTNLEDGIRTTDEQTTWVNQLAFKSIANRFQHIFEQAIPSKRAFLELSDEKVEVSVKIGWIHVRH